MNFLKKFFNKTQEITFCTLVTRERIRNGLPNGPYSTGYTVDMHYIVQLTDT